MFVAVGVDAAAVVVQHYSAALADSMVAEAAVEAGLAPGIAHCSRKALSAGHMGCLGRADMGRHLAGHTARLHVVSGK
jgi:hypothetical protein